MKSIGTTLFLMVLGMISLGIIWAIPIQWLWNNTLVSAVDGINKIGFWQAYGLYLLSSILIKSSSSDSIKSS